MNDLTTPAGAKINTLDAMKNKLNSIPKAIRNAERWNSMREDFRKTYTEQDISNLDASGFIGEWMK